MLIIKQLMVPIDFHSISFSTMEVNGDQQLFGSIKIFIISSFVFNIRKKLIQVWNDMRVSKWWQHFHFWVNYSFKYCKNNNKKILQNTCSTLVDFLLPYLCSNHLQLDPGKQQWCNDQARKDTNQQDYNFLSSKMLLDLTMQTSWCCYLVSVVFWVVDYWFKLKQSVPKSLYSLVCRFYLQCNVRIFLLYISGQLADFK